MSEYTTVYLRKKGTPILKYREHPRYDEIKDKSEAEISSLYKEVDDYNKTVDESFGCELFYLTTTPSRQLHALPWSPDAKELSKDLLEEVLAFYDEEIESYERIIREREADIERLEVRILKANVDLYDKIDEEIRDCKESIEGCREEVEELRHYRSKFDFLKGILQEDSNAERYELVYTKC